MKIDKWKTYKTKKGTLLKAIEYKNDMADGFDTKINKHYIIINKHKIYISEGNHLFIFDGEDKVGYLLSDLFMNLVQ